MAASLFQISGVTLRGIGPYIKGARLEVRPFTVLCGPNGSGKSTWLKVLAMLRASSTRQFLPFSFDTDEYDIRDIQYTNALAFLEFDEAVRPAVEAELEPEYGPLGAIGVDMVATRNARFGAPLQLVASSLGCVDKIARSFLVEGDVSKGMKIRVRLAHPKHFTLEDGRDHLHDLVEMQFNDRYVIRLERPLAQQKMVGGRPEMVFPPYAVFCTPTLLSQQGNPMLLVQAGAIAQEQIESAMADPGQVVNGGILLAAAAAIRAREVLALALDSFFHITAIRWPEAEAEVKDEVALGVENDAGLTQRTASLKPHDRYVGPNGERSWLVQRRYAYNLLRNPREPHVGHFDQRISPAQFTAGWGFISNQTNAAAQHILALADPTTIQAVKEHRGDAEASVAAVLNSVLANRNLYRPGLWSEDDIEVRAFLDRGIENLTPDEVVRLNRLLIETEFHIIPATRYLMEGLVSWWLRRLTGVYIGTVTRTLNKGRQGPFSLDEGWQRRDDPPVGFLQDEAPKSPAEFTDPDGPLSTRYGEDRTELARLRHACFGDFRGEAQPPRAFSAGFHQIVPCVVQAAVMLPHELLAIENPEVHLHPSLQLQFTEFLMQMALSGRQIIIETHSDLVIRRIIRGIMEETLPQQSVSVNFTELGQDVSGYRTAVLRRLEVDARGTINNWPKGFLDDDIAESRRVLRLVYGDPPQPESREDLTE